MSVSSPQGFDCGGSCAVYCEPDDNFDGPELLQFQGWFGLLTFEVVGSQDLPSRAPSALSLW